MVRIDSELGVGGERPLRQAADLPLNVVCDRRHSRDRFMHVLGGAKSR